MFPLHKGKTASFLEWGATLGGVDFCIWSFLSGDFTDSGVVISVAWWTSIGISWSCIKSPVTIKISSFLDRGCEHGRLRCQKHHLLIEGAVEIVAEGKHLGSIIDMGPLGMLAPFLVPLVELLVPCLAGIHLGNCLYLCLRGYELFLKNRFEIGPCSVVCWGVAQGGGHEVACPFSGLCSFLKWVRAMVIFVLSAV